MNTAAAGRIVAGLDRRLTFALALGLASMVEVLAIDRRGDTTSSMLLNLCATVPLALWRPGRPWVAVIVTLSTFVLIAGVGALTVSAAVAQLVVLYLLAASQRRLVAAPFALPFAVNAIEPIGAHASDAFALVLLVLVVAALLLGDARRQRGHALAERDASRQAMEHSLREQAAMEERARIARELHDVVAHNLSMISVQAETARLTAPGMSPEGRGHVEAIGTTARDALAEMRRLLGVLRADAGGRAEREPQPGLARLDGLVDAARDAGTPVRFTLGGHVVPLPPSVDLSVYRIVQEALTNSRRHAPGAAVDVEVRYGPGCVQVRVRDDGPGPTEADRDGHGLLGMRERAAMAGGTLRVGRAAGGGFLVEADLPIPGPDA